MSFENCPLCANKSFDNISTLYRSLVNFTTKEFECKQCLCRLNGLNAFIEHLRQVHVELGKKCSKCNLSFNDEVLLGTHEKLVHGNEFECEICHKVFKIRSSLRVHLKVAHNRLQSDGIKCWECEVCKKSFTTKYFLKKHNRLHTGETPYKCGICEKSFTFQQSYYKHMLYHNTEKKHMCRHCGRTFKESGTLQNHERIHSGDKPFVCEICSKSFRQKISYLVHKRIHTGIMPYQCQFCDIKFRYKVSLNSHKCEKMLQNKALDASKSDKDLLEKLLNDEYEMDSITSDFFNTLLFN